MSEMDDTNEIYRPLRLELEDINMNCSENVDYTGSAEGTEIEEASMAGQGDSPDYTGIAGSFGSICITFDGLANKQKAMYYFSMLQKLNVPFAMSKQEIQVEYYCNQISFAIANRESDEPISIISTLSVSTIGWLMHIWYNKYMYDYRILLGQQTLRDERLESGNWSSRRRAIDRRKDIVAVDHDMIRFHEKLCDAGCNIIPPVRTLIWLIYLFNAANTVPSMSEQRAESTNEWLWMQRNNVPLLPHSHRALINKASNINMLAYSPFRVHWSNKMASLTNYIELKSEMDRYIGRRPIDTLLLEEESHILLQHIMAHRCNKYIINYNITMQCRLAVYFLGKLQIPVTAKLQVLIDQQAVALLYDYIRVNYLSKHIEERKNYHGKSAQRPGQPWYEWPNPIADDICERELGRWVFHQKYNALNNIAKYALPHNVNSRAAGFFPLQNMLPEWTAEYTPDERIYYVFKCLYSVYSIYITEQKYVQLFNPDNDHIIIPEDIYYHSYLRPIITCHDIEFVTNSLDEFDADEIASAISVIEKLELPYRTSICSDFIDLLKFHIASK